MEWKNTRDPYNDYIHFEEAPPLMQRLIIQNTWFFDDSYFYWQVPFTDVIKRRPLYWYPQKSTPCEKHIVKERPKVPIDQWGK